MKFGIEQHVKSSKKRYYIPLCVTIESINLVDKPGQASRNEKGPLPGMDVVIEFRIL